MAAYPKVVAFDLDYTLWPYWVDTHIDPPLKRRNDALNEVVDRSGQKLSFFPHVPSILLELREKGVHIAAASRTCAPTVARQALRELMLDTGKTNSSKSPRQTGRASQAQSVAKAISTSRRSPALFDQLEIYPGSKVEHFRKIAQESGVDYGDMSTYIGSPVFFDDESRNGTLRD